MRVYILFTMLLLTGCGSDYKTEITKSYPTVETQSFEGVYYLPNNGYIELTQADDGDVTFDTAYQSIVSENPQNNTFAHHPAISGKYEVNSNKILFGKDVDYRTGSQYDLEEDSSGSDITGRHYTTFLVEKVGDEIRLTITIYDGTKNNNLNGVIAKRVLVSS